MTPTDRRATDAGAWLRDLHDRVVAWHDRSGDYRTTARTSAYLRLLFACGFARLGLRDAAEEFSRAADRVLTAEGAPHDLLLAGFTFRIGQALSGIPWEGPLPTDWHARREQLGLSRSAVDCLLGLSAVLEPASRVYLNTDVEIQLEKETDSWLAALPGMDRSSRHLLPPWLLCRALRRPQLDRDVVRELLGFVLERADPAWMDVAEHSTSEELDVHRAAVDAACRHDLRAGFFDLLSQMLQWCRSVPESARLLADVLRSYVRGLFRLRLCEEADQFLEAASRLLCRGSTMEAWLVTDETKGRQRLRCMLALANGWHAFGWGPLSRPAVELAMPLLEPQSRPLAARAQLARELVESFWLSDQAFARERLAWVLERLPGLRDSFPTATYFARFVVGLTESVVTTAVEVCRRR